MRLLHGSLALISLCIPAWSATFGTVVPGSGGASYSDILLDENHRVLYLVNSSANKIDIYSLASKAFTSSIKTDSQPVSLALSPDGKTLYCTAYTASILDIVDLTKTTLAVTAKVGLPASPEGVAVGADGRVLISTVGNSGNNVLIVYDPSQPSGKNLSNVPVTPAAPTPPTLPAPSNTAFLSYHSKLISTKDGKFIIGNNITSTSTTNGRVVFVYDTASSTVLRSRIVANLSNVLSVSPDGTKFMAGPALFDTASLAIVAQENTANSPFAFPANANFNTQNTQGGSVFSPDGTMIWAAFNFAPVQNPAVAANVSRLMVNDPDNLLIKLGLQMPENLSGKMVITAAGDTIYALSQSGFITIPLSTLTNQPLIQTDSQVELVINDQCGVYAQNATVAANVTNGGKGKLTVSVQSYTLPNTGVTGLGGAGGPGGTIVFGPGGTITVVGGTTTTTTTASGTTPIVTTKQTSTGASLSVKFNPSAASNLGTVAPTDFLIQAPEAVNIAPNFRVFQNNRNSEAAGTILLTQQNISAGEALMDMVMDTARKRIYVSNSGMNQIEVVDMTTQKLLTPIKVGQLPHSMAISTDGNTMYVGNTGGESISIVDLNKMQTVGSVQFPPVPSNVAVSVTYPAAIAYAQTGPQVVMSDGSLWKIDGTQAIPRTLNQSLFGGSNATLVRTVSGGNPSQFSMAATPAGEYVLLVTGAGNAYLYDSSVDDYTKVQSLFSTPLTGFIGPIAAGPKGAYFVANGTLLNSSLTPIAGLPGTTTGTTVTGPGLPGTTTTTSSRPVSAAAAVSATAYALFTQPVRTSATSAVTDAGLIELHDTTTGATMRTVNALEGPESTVTGTGRATIPGRTLIVDSSLTYAYAITTSGISVIPLTAASPATSPRVSSGGVVNLASYQSAVAPGTLISIFGTGLGSSAQFSSTPAPTILGGTCVTLNNVAIPLELTSSGQINAQIPVNLAAGKYPLVVRSISNLIASQSTIVTVAKYAPAVFVTSSGQAAIVKASNGSLVNAKNPATRDEDLIIYATGLGVTTGGTVTTGNPAPSSPLAVTAPVSVYMGNPSYSQSPVIVEWSGLVPGYIGLYQINVRIPGTHMDGNTLPVTIKIGGISSPATGPAVPTVALN